MSGHTLNIHTKCLVCLALWCATQSLPRAGHRDHARHHLQVRGGRWTGPPTSRPVSWESFCLADWNLRIVCPQRRRRPIVGTLRTAVVPAQLQRPLSSVEDSFEGIEDQAQPELEVLVPSSLHDMSDDLCYVGVLAGGDLGQDGG